jgi:drug/metabolite transporter (DMT)-like permease
LENQKKPSGFITYAVLIAGMIVISFTSPMLKETLDLGLTSVSITFYRIAISAAVIWIMIALKPGYRTEVKSVTKRDFWLICLGGFFRAANMVLWVFALTFSPVFLVSALLRTNPVWVIAGSYLFLGKQTPLKSLIGVGICLVGVAICALGGFSDESNNPIGMVLILFSAVLFGLNLIVSGVIREKFSLWPTMGMTFLFAAVLLFVTCLITGESLGPFSPMAWVWLLALSLICTLLGQSTSVWALKHIPATNVSLINLLAPFFAGVTTFFLRGEVPNLLTIAGTVVMVIGLAVFFRLEARRKTKETVMQLDTPPLATPVES